MSEPRGKPIDVILNGKPTTLYLTDEPFTIHDLVAMMEQEAADRGVNTTPALDHARRLRDEATS